MVKRSPRSFISRRWWVRTALDRGRAAAPRRRNRTARRRRRAAARSWACSPLARLAAPRWSPRTADRLFLSRESAMWWAPRPGLRPHPRLPAWTSTPPTPRGSPGSRPARCRSRSPTPSTNARRVVEQARACHDDAVAVAVFPELCLSGYSVDDLFLQDTLLAAVDDGAPDRGRGEPGPRAGAGRRRPGGARLPGAQLRGGDPPRPRARRRAEVEPAHLPRVLRAPLVRARRRPRRPRGHRGRSGRAVGPRPAVPRRRRARAGGPRRGVRGHVGPGAAQRARRAGRCDGAAQPVRQPDHRRAAPRSAACWFAAPAPAAWPPTSTPPQARASPPRT